MKAVILRLKLLQPLLVARPGAGEENASESYDFIPGGVIRGALIARYLARNPGADIARPMPGESRRPFFDGSCCFLNGYPVAEGGQRMLPIPLAWRVEKSAGEGSSAVYDFAVEGKEDLDAPAGLREGFAWTDGNKVEIKRPGRFLMVHNASETRGHKKAGSSFVYRYETLAEGQEFVAAIAGEYSHALADELGLAPGLRLHLGGSRSANYGETLLAKVEKVDAWSEAPGRPNAAGCVIITLLSDAILTDASGQPAADLVPALKAAATEQYVRTRLVGGFNRKWGLPLPQAMALQAGSVFVYDGGTLTQNTLQSIAQEGIGERRVEGFGRVAVNWQGGPWYNPKAPSSKPAGEVDQSSAPVLHQSASQQLAGKMAERRMRALLERRLAEALAGLKIQDPPLPAQLSRLRSVARLAAQEKNLGLIPAHVDALKSAKDQLERARVVRNGEADPERLNDWLKNHTARQAGENPENWTLWSEFLKLEEPVVVAGAAVPQEAVRDMEVEYTARLLDGLFRRTTREIQDKQEGSGGEDGGSME